MVKTFFSMRKLVALAFSLFLVVGYGCGSDSEEVVKYKKLENQNARSVHLFPDSAAEERPVSDFITIHDDTINSD